MHRSAGADCDREPQPVRPRDSPPIVAARAFPGGADLRPGPGMLVGGGARPRSFGRGPSDIECPQRGTLLATPFAVDRRRALMRNVRSLAGTVRRSFTESRARAAANESFRDVLRRIDVAPFIVPGKSRGGRQGGTREYEGSRRRRTQDQQGEGDGRWPASIRARPTFAVARSRGRSPRTPARGSIAGNAPLERASPGGGREIREFTTLP